MPSDAGYSGTPLARKLGFKASSCIFLVGTPEGYAALLEPLPEGIVFESIASQRTDFVHVFVTQKEELEDRLCVWRETLRSDAVIWVSWPKKASRVPTTVTENTIREVAIPLGFVDIKVCSVNEVWSALKLVVRRELR